MKRDQMRGVIVGAVLLVLYILIAFLIPFVHTAVFWVSFLFTLVAFALAAVALYTAFLKKPDARSRFYGFPIARIGVVYWLIQLILGLVFMALGQWIPVWAAVLVYAIALGAAVVGLISADAVTDEIHVQDRRLKEDVTLMRTLQSRLNQMAAQCQRPDDATAVGKLAEELRYSDPVSKEALKDAEADLRAAVDELEQAVVENSGDAIRQLCKKASTLLAERNRLCKLNK